MTPLQFPADRNEKAAFSPAKTDGPYAIIYDDREHRTPQKSAEGQVSFL